MKLLFKIQPATLSYCFFFALIAISLLAPLASETFIPNYADFINHLGSVIQAKMALMEGQFPLRVMPFEQGGFRYPQFQFYSPSAYTLAALIYQHITPENPLIAMQITLGLGLWLGGIYIYRIAYDFVASIPAAYLAGLVYLTAPYYIITVNHLGNLTETLALGFFPAALFYSLRSLYQPASNKTLLLMSFAWYLVATTHIITFLYGSLFAGVFIIALGLREKLSLWQVASGYLLGSALAAWYLIPVAEFNPYFLIGTTYNTTTHFSQYSPVLAYLLFPGAGLTQGSMSALERIHPAVGWPILFGIGLSLYAWAFKEDKTVVTAKPWLIVLVPLFLLAFLFAWTPFNFWPVFPRVFLAGQYSWRWLDQTLWIGALVFAWSACYLFKNDLTSRHVVLGALLLAALANPWFPEVPRYQTSLADFMRDPHLQIADSAYLLNFNQYPQWVNEIDRMQLDPLMLADHLELNKTYHLPLRLTQLTLRPAILLQLKLPNNIPNLALSLRLNQEIIATKLLTPGSMQWEIPLSHLSSTKQTNDIAFTLSTQKAVELPINTVALEGFLDPETTLGLDQTQRLCRQDKAMKLCHVQVGEHIKLVELPVLYYPKLLRITINGIETPYHSVLYGNKLIVGITPHPGQINDIHITFQGLSWANKISWAAFGVAFYLLVIGLFHRLTQSRVD